MAILCRIGLLCLLVCSFPYYTIKAQVDSTCIQEIGKNAQKYLSQVNSKIGVYQNRVSSKTLKTFSRLSRWENHLKNALEKVSPQSVNDLFGNNQLTFTSAYDKLLKAEQVFNDTKGKLYNEYLDKLQVQLKYLRDAKQVQTELSPQKLSQLESQLKLAMEDDQQHELLKQFIITRKTELIKQGLKYLGKNRYLSKMHKETWYYLETLKNYKSLLEDPTKAEELVISALNRIPVFQEFFQRNSFLAQLFRLPGNSPSNLPQADNVMFAGLQTRSDLIQDMQGRFGGGQQVQQLLQQNLQQAQGRLSEVKDKILKDFPIESVNSSGVSWNDPNSPNGATQKSVPNTQKTKTFLQRLEYGTNIKSQRPNGYFPVTSDIGLSLGYKLNDKSLLELGMGYKIGWGSSIQNIRISCQGISLRGGLNLKLKGNLFITGNYEQNYFTQVNNLRQLSSWNQWKQAALLGLQKKYQSKNKKGGDVRILYDFFYNRPPLKTQAITLQFGFNFK